MSLALKPGVSVGTRKPRMLSSAQRRHGGRTGYTGTEVFVSLVDSREAPYSERLEQRSVSGLREITAELAA